MIVILTLEFTLEILNLINLFPHLCMLTFLLWKKQRFGEIINSSAALAQLPDCDWLVTETSASLCHPTSVRESSYCSA